MAVSDEIKEQKSKFKNMTGREKASYIWDYYKIHIIAGLIIIIFGSVLIRDIRENNKPTYLYAVFINSNFAVDTSNTLEDDYIRCMDIDTDKEHAYFSYDINFSDNYFDTTFIAYQQKLVALYEAKDLDIVVGPVGIMETSADCNGYGNLEELLPSDLLDELTEKGYEFYTYSGRKYTDEEKSFMDEEDLKELENFTPYVAGIYLDTCPYLNNMGEYGAYNMASDESGRPILTIPESTQRLEHAIDFVRFITQ